MTKQSISDEIAAAMKDKTLPSDKISDLLERARSAAEARRHEAARERESALDPALSESSAAEVYSRAERIKFEADRLAIAVEHLEDALTVRLYEEDQAAKTAVYKAAAQERDRVAKIIKATYPQIEERLSEMIREIVTANVQVNAANADLPDGASMLAKAEAVARSFPAAGTGAYRNGGPVLIAEMLVPKFDNCLSAAWPPQFNPWPGAPRPTLHQLEHMAAIGDL